MNIEHISQSWRNIAPLLVPVFSEEDCDRREEQLKNLIIKRSLFHILLIRL